MSEATGSASESVSTPESTGSTPVTESTPSAAPSGGGKVPSSEQASQSVVDAMQSAEKQPDGSYEITVDGETISLTLDQLKAGYQKAQASAKRFQEAAEERKRAAEEKKAAEEFKNKLRQNPLKALLEDGVDVKAIRNHYEAAVWEFLQQDQMTPEQKAEIKAKQEMETEKQRIAREKAEIENWKKEREREREEMEVRKHQETYAAQINDALNKHGLPQSPEVVAKMAGYLSQALEHGYDMSIDEAAAMYKEDTEVSLKGLLKKYSPEQLMSLLGEDGMKALRSKDVEQHVKQPTHTKKPAASSPPTTEKKVSARDFFSSLK
jgi:hypothetical protein